MKKTGVFSLQNQKGAGLLELLVAVAVFTVGILAFGHLFTASYTTSTYNINENEALDLAREGLEAVRSIRNNDFEDLAPGEYELTLVENKWTLTTFAEEPETINERYKRTIEISNYEEDENRKKVVSTVTWKDGQESVSLTERLTFWQEGRYALEFSESGNSVEIEQHGVFKLKANESFSYGLWYKGTQTSSGAFLSISYNNSPHRGADLWLDSSAGDVAVHLIHSWSDDAIKRRTDSEGEGFIAVNDGNWHHIFATYDGSKNASGVKIYVDGVFQPEGTHVDTLTSDVIYEEGWPTRMSGRSDGDKNQSNPVLGLIDDVRIYNKTLSQAEIQNLYDKRYRSDVASDNLVGWWSMNEGEDNTVYDKSGNDNDGTIEGATWTEI